MNNIVNLFQYDIMISTGGEISLQFIIIPFVLLYDYLIIILCKSTKIRENKWLNLTNEKKIYKK